MKVGRAHLGTHPIASVTDLHSSFGHTDRLGYLRREILCKHGLMDDKNDREGKDKWYTQIKYWSKKGMKMVSISMDDDDHFTFQTTWMADMLVLKEEDGEAYSGGLLSDVTYKFFLNGYLLTTSMFNEKLQRWVPILLSWLGDREKRRLVEQVVDFSAAQKNGFIDAYMEVFNVHDRKIAFLKLHGCEQHYQQAVTRISKNHKIVKVNMVATWKTKCRELLLPDEPGREDLETRFKELRRLFPLAKRWIDWWHAADVQAMLFPARKRIPEDDPPLPEEDSSEDETGNRDKRRRRPELPKTTNAQESLHRVYYMLCDGKCSIIEGMIQLFAFVSCLERDYQARLKGIPVTYGSSKETWQEVVTSLGMAKPTKRRFVANDGRAPDTTKELLDYDKSKGKKASKKKGPARPQGSQNINRSALTTYQSYTAGRTVGSRNRCWMSATLESLYALWGPLWSDRTHVNGTSLVTIIIRHFTGRLDVELNEGKHLAGLLTRGQNIIHKEIQKIKPESYKSDEFCSADGFMDMIVEHAYIRPMFALDVTKTLICPSNIQHTRSTTRSIAVLRILPLMFRETSLAYGELDTLLQEWINDVSSPNLAWYAVNVIQRRSKATKSKSQQCSNNERKRYMGDANWPARIIIGVAQYQLITRGFWGGNHYWCQLVRSVEGVLGVWHYDELKNGGFAQLVSRDVDTIAGCIPETSWTCYMRIPFEPEKTKIKHSLIEMMNKFPNQHFRIPFSMPTNTSPFGGGLPSAEEPIESPLSTSILPDGGTMDLGTNMDISPRQLSNAGHEIDHNQMNEDLLYGNLHRCIEDDIIGTEEAAANVDEDALSQHSSEKASDSEELGPPLNAVKFKIKLAVPKVDHVKEEFVPPRTQSARQAKSVPLKADHSAGKRKAPAAKSNVDNASAAAKRKASAEKRRATAEKRKAAAAEGRKAAAEKRMRLKKLREE
ncbi:uncharacterized protein MELLADRAFT_84704 [Melampsora larici-populina 98AG31]|uniref:Uncharacterized protein n=1 Tax=Melampsora larici-populina (strain 98AG31 / pathotype 3-4-7) TaxID=747676 RepID=F4RGK4_MELLP|nr:uncharacterized protein MELLADRAFT_84704 [Melampsora larici-populina 98AG31]EGG08523.1 hypothetical protein MELLADRAFT_84704 [Melampsora larici-populina 98AG31]